MAGQFKYKNILLCTDYSKDAEASLVHAFDQTVKYGATLHIALLSHDIKNILEGRQGGCFFGQTRGQRCPSGQD